MFLTEAKKEATEVNLSHIQWRNLPFTLYAEQKSSNRAGAVKVTLHYSTLP